MISIQIHWQKGNILFDSLIIQMLQFLFLISIDEDTLVCRHLHGVKE